MSVGRWVMHSSNSSASQFFFVSALSKLLFPCSESVRCCRFHRLLKVFFRGHKKCVHGHGARHEIFILSQITNFMSTMAEKVKYPESLYFAACVCVSVTLAMPFFLFAFTAAAARIAMCRKLPSGSFPLNGSNNKKHSSSFFSLVSFLSMAPELL